MSLQCLPYRGKRHIIILAIWQDHKIKQVTRYLPYRLMYIVNIDHSLSISQTN